MPQDNIDRILQKVIQRRMGDKRFPSPIAISKGHFQFKKGAERCYLPKPPTPKLTAVRQIGKKMKMHSGMAYRHHYHSRYQMEGDDPHTWETKSEQDSNEWGSSVGYEGHRDSNMDWYGGNENPNDEEEEPDHEEETENHAWGSDQQDDHMNGEAMEEGMED